MEPAIAKKVEVFQLGKSFVIRGETLDKLPDPDKLKSYIIIIAEAGPDPVPEFNR